MCGIAGWLRLRAGPIGDSRLNEPPVRVIEEVMDRQHHRGPDARGLWISPNQNAVFGHNRLSIVELTDAGAQPMVDNDSDWAITYNGELYNHKNLRQTLESSIRFVSKEIATLRFSSTV